MNSPSSPSAQFPLLWLDDLRRQAEAQRTWLWQGYLAPGNVTLLTSQWKAGKTTLLSILLDRMKTGGTLAARPKRERCGRDVDGPPADAAVDGGGTGGAGITPPAQAGVGGRSGGAGQRRPVRLRGRTDRDALVRAGRGQRPPTSPAGLVAL